MSNPVTLALYNIHAAHVLFLAVKFCGQGLVVLKSGFGRVTLNHIYFYVCSLHKLPAKDGQPPGESCTPLWVRGGDLSHALSRDHIEFKCDIC